MAQPAVSRGSIDLERTRRQLRELDTLLQRVLLLPTVDGPPAPKPDTIPMQPETSKANTKQWIQSQPFEEALDEAASAPILPLLAVSPSAPLRDIEATPPMEAQSSHAAPGLKIATPEVVEELEHEEQDAAATAVMDLSPVVSDDCLDASTLDVSGPESFDVSFTDAPATRTASIDSSAVIRSRINVDIQRDAANKRQEAPPDVSGPALLRTGLGVAGVVLLLASAVLWFWR